MEKVWHSFPSRWKYCFIEYEIELFCYKSRWTNLELKDILKQQNIGMTKTI